jgi:peptide deformylase
MLPILTYPNKVLEEKSQEVRFPVSTETKKLIDQMWSVVRKNGVGLAAPQVGVNKKICIIYLSQTESGKNAKDLLLINPKITFYSSANYEMIEGCLSFPDEYYKIVRPANILVEYKDINGKMKKLSAGGWLSRVIQHEVDHLEGELFINKGGEKINPEKINKSEIID